MNVNSFRIMVLNATSINISDISWMSALLVEEIYHFMLYRVLFAMFEI